MKVLNIGYFYHHTVKSAFVENEGGSALLNFFFNIIFIKKPGWGKQPGCIMNFFEFDL
jgi:hypothetical protein